MESSNCENQNCIYQGEVTLENRDERMLLNMIICLPHELRLELLSADEAREAFDVLEAKLTHDVGRDLDEHETVLRQMLEQDIVAAYYYQSGVLEAGLRHDRQLEAAVGVLTEKIAEKR